MAYSSSIIDNQTLWEAPEEGLSKPYTELIKNFEKEWNERDERIFCCKLNETYKNTPKVILE